MTNHFYDITMPSLGADMTEGTLVEWFIKVGDEVQKGDIVAVIESQKGAIDMEIYESGQISEILVHPGTLVPVGTILARLVTDAEVADTDPMTVPDTTRVEGETGAENLANTQTAPPMPDRSGIIASPAVRKRAQVDQLDLANIKGSGPSGAILLRDIDSSEIRSPEPATKPGTMRDAIAKAMEKSNQEIPHYYLALDIDITYAQQWLQQQNANKEPEHRTLFLALLLKAVASSLAKYPSLNGYYMDGKYQASKAIHIGNVISLREGGLMAPAIHDVDQLSLPGIMEALRDISHRSRSGHLRSSELTDATITVTSMGERGSDQVLGVIYPPQVAIIGAGRPRRLPRVQDENIVISDIINVSLSADHRVSDGIVGAKFLNALAKTLQQPESL